MSHAHVYILSSKRAQVQLYKGITRPSFVHSVKGTIKGTQKTFVFCAIGILVQLLVEKDIGIQNICRPQKVKK